MINTRGATGGARGGEYYILKPWWSNGTVYAHGGQCSGLKESILFLEKVYFLFLGAAKLRLAGGGARSAPIGAAMCFKRRVRAAHGRARAAKTH
jgi:hypothetical protein